MSDDSDQGDDQLASADDGRPGSLRPDGRTDEHDRVAVNYDIGSVVADRPTTVQRARVDYNITGAAVVSHDDQVRRLLATRLLWLLTGTICAGILLLVTTPLTGLDAEDVKSWFGVIFTAVLTLVSTAVGFYFGAESRKQGTQTGNETP